MADSNMKLIASFKNLARVAPDTGRSVTAHPDSQRASGFNYAVNGFRGVCILLVFVYHVYNAGLLPKPPYASGIANACAFFASSFRYGVELFFMISGYVIVASLRRHRSIGTFLWDRFARIFPVWIPIHIGIFTVGVLAGLKRFHGMSAGEQVVTFFANLVLLPPLINVPVSHDASWSLSYEWLFYLLAAAAVAVTHLRSALGRIALWSLWIAVVGLLLCLLPRGLFFIPGAIIGLGWLPLNKLVRGLRHPIVGLLLFLIAWRCVDLDQAAPGVYPISDFVGMGSLPLTLFSLLAGLYLFACICTDDGEIAWLQNRVSQFFGNVSYSFYLWHPIVMFVVKRLTYAYVVPSFGRPLGLICFATASFVIATFISYVSYQLLEVRVSKALRRLFDRRVHEAAPIAETAAVVRPVYLKGR